MAGRTTIYWRNRVDDAALTASSAAAALPVTNLADWRPDKPWRATAGADQWFELAWPALTNVSAAVVWKHTMSSAGTVRVRVWQDVAKTVLLYDSGAIPAWPMLFGWGLGGWGETGWGGYPSADQIASLSLRPAVIHNFGATFGARAVRIDVSDATQSFLDIGRAFVGLGYEVGFNPDYGMQIQHVDQSVRRRTECGGLSIDRRPVYRRVSMQWGYLYTADSLEFYDLAGALGQSVPFFIDCLPGDPQFGERLILYAVAESQGPLVAAHPECWSKDLVIEEVL